VKSRILTLIAAMTLLAATLAIPVRLAAQDNQDHKHKHYHYKLSDLGTFGGPNSTVGFFEQVVNERGTVTGGADTPTPDRPDHHPVKRSH
jgi:hypothetical protein